VAFVPTADSSPWTWPGAYEKEQVEGQLEKGFLGSADLETEVVTASGKA
jgi:hypothetical protein